MPSSFLTYPKNLPALLSTKSRINDQKSGVKYHFGNGGSGSIDYPNALLAGLATGWLTVNSRT